MFFPTVRFVHIRVINNLLLVVFLLILSVACIRCRAQEQDFDEAEITKFIASQMKTFQIPGAAVGIIRRDRILYLKSFGAADDTGHRITPKSPFLIGSNSKSFTALAVMQLVEAGRVDLDTPVVQYLPWFRLKDIEASNRITVRHLLNHTSGLSDSDSVPRQIVH